MLRRVSLLALLLGCGLDVVPPPDAMLPNDDDSADEDGPGVGDDDDAADDDDADDDEGTLLGAIVELRTSEEDARWVAGLSFDADGGEMVDFVLPGEGPLPGAGLAPELGLVDGCEVLESDAPAALLPTTDDAGDVTLEAQGRSIALERARGIYSGSGDGLLPDGPWVAAVGGGAEWIGEQIPVGDALPDVPVGVLPGAGTLGSLSEFEVTWTTGSGPVEVLAHRSRGGDDWLAVRCIGPDNGSMRVRAESLAAATGPLYLSVSRAHWGPAPDRFGLVRTHRAELTIGR